MRDFQRYVSIRP